MSTVLLVEDDRFLRRAAQATLKQRGYTVRTAADGEEALRQADEAPDLILLDLIMPKVQGFEVLRRLKQNPATASIPVIVLSNLGQESDMERAVQDGAARYFVKTNLSLDELGEHVDTVLVEHAN